MGSTCSCENNNAICNVDTYNSVTGSKNCRVSLANDIFEEKSYRKNLLENVFRKNMANKIQRCYRNYSMIRKSDKNSYEGINYVKSSDNNPKDLNKRNDCKNITFAQGNDHKANNSTVMSMSNLRSSVIYNVAEERLNFEVILITNGAKSEGKESLNNSIKRKEGYMTIITYDSVQINGRYIYDNLTGFAHVMTIDDEFFQGEFVDSIANGFGIYTSTKVVEYVGEWKDNQKNGYGMETRHSHSIYSGDYLCGKKEGFGFLKLSDGSFYQGNLKDNNFNGYGIYTFSDGRVFIGEWKNSVMDGYGEFLWKDGNKYYGYYLADKKEGFGIFYWPKSVKFFVGFWKNGKQEGIGKKFTKDNVKYNLWKSGKIVCDYENVQDALHAFSDEQNIYLKFFEMDVDNLLDFFR